MHDLQHGLLAAAAREQQPFIDETGDDRHEQRRHVRQPHRAPHHRAAFAQAGHAQQQRAQRQHLRIAGLQHRPGALDAAGHRAVKTAQHGAVVGERDAPTVAAPGLPQLAQCEGEQREPVAAACFVHQRGDELAFDFDAREPRRPFDDLRNARCRQRTDGVQVGRQRALGQARLQRVEVIKPQREQQHQRQRGRRGAGQKPCQRGLRVRVERAFGLVHRQQHHALAGTRLRLAQAAQQAIEGSDVAVCRRLHRLHRLQRGGVGRWLLRKRSH